MSAAENSSPQLTTFYIDGDLFGIEVMKVQEVTGQPDVFGVPLAPGYVRGLINLRGQIATALGLREVFKKAPISAASQMSVVCKIDGNLVSFLVDSIGDVLEADGARIEPPPDSIPFEVRRFLKGIYKMNGAFLSVLDLETLSQELSPTAETAAERKN